MSGVEELVLELFGVEVEFGLDVLFGFEEFMSELLLLLELGEVEVLLELDGVLLVLVELDGDVEFMSELLVLLELDGEVEFISELLLELEGEVVEEGEVELLEPVWLDWLDGVL